jgi:hypothetical protein
MWIELTQNAVHCFCEHGDEPLDSIMECSEQRKYYQLLKEDAVPELGTVSTHM